MRSAGTASAALLTPREDQGHYLFFSGDYFGLFEHLDLPQLVATLFAGVIEDHEMSSLPLRYFFLSSLPAS
jgi:hypothetical protein